MSNLTAITHSYRSKLQQQQATTEHALRSHYAHLLATLKPHLDAIYQEIQAKQESMPKDEEEGTQEREKIPLHWLYEQHRLDKLKQIVIESVNTFGKSAHATIQEGQQKARVLGKESGGKQVESVREK